MDLLKVPFGDCQFYSGDTIGTYSRYYPYDVRQRLDLTGNVAMTKANARPQIINNAMGYVDRFQTFIDSYLTGKLLAPLEAQTADSSVKDSLAAKLDDISAKNKDLREYLDSQDTDMVASVADAWSQDKDIITQSAQKSAGVLSQAESQGPQLINAEMRQMLNVANQAVRTNSQTISQLARAEILQTNSTGREVQSQAKQLLQATNSTLSRAKTVFSGLNTTSLNLATSQSKLNARLATLKNAIIAKAQSSILTAQNRSSDAQIRASSQVDSSLQSVVQAVATALQRLTNEENSNLTTITSSVDTSMNTLASQIQSNLNDANRIASALQTAYQQNVSSTVSDANQLLTQIDQSLASTNGSLNAANSTMQALQGFMTTQFNDLDNQLTAAFNNQSQQVQLQQNALYAFMDAAIASFKSEAMNLTSQGSASLKSAYDAAIQAVTSGSDSLSLSFEQRQKIIAALQNWQQSYQGNTNQLVSAFSNTYGGLVTDTNAALAQAVEQQAAQISSLSADQQKLMTDAVAAAQGDPTKLNAILAQFGIVGDRATAAATVVAQNMLTAGSSIQDGLGNGMTALGLIQQAAQATSDTYKQADSLNAQAATTAQSAVQNVTARLGTMNAVLQTYATKLSDQLFGASSDANNQIQGAATENSEKISTDLQTKMAAVQDMLTQVLSKGQSSSQELNEFAARVGANATALTNLVNALQTGSSDAISAITDAQKSSIDQLKSQVAAQLGSVSADFSNQLQGEKSSLASLIEGLRSDLTAQSGAKSNLLIQQRDLLQSLFGQMSSSSIQRQSASKNMQKQLSDAQGKSSISLTELTGLIGAQKSRVMTAFHEKSEILKSAAASVNETVVETQDAANSALADLRSKGDARVAAVEKSLKENSVAIDMMIERYESLVAAALDEDRQERLKTQAEELSKVQSLQDYLTKSQADQLAAYTYRQTQAKARADALAGMIASFSGAAAAASQGDKAFVEYVTALAGKTNTNMGLLVQAMKDKMASGTSDLKDLLSKNGIFSEGVLSDLSAQAAALGQGAVDGGNGLLESLLTARSQSDAAAASQTATFSGIDSSKKEIQALTNDQLVELISIFLAQSALQDSDFAKSNQDTLNSVASLSDSMDLALSAMDTVGDMTQDALQLATDETNESEVEVDEATKAVIDYAYQASNSITQSSQGYYNSLKQAIDQATSFNSAYRERLNDDEKTLQEAKPQIDTSVAKLKTDIANLSTTLNANKQAAIDRVNQWAMATEQDALNQLSNMQMASTR